MIDSYKVIQGYDNESLRNYVAQIYTSPSNEPLIIADCGIGYSANIRAHEIADALNAAAAASA